MNKPHLRLHVHMDMARSPAWTVELLNPPQRNTVACLSTREFVTSVTALGAARIMWWGWSPS